MMSKHKLPRLNTYNWEALTEESEALAVMTEKLRHHAHKPMNLPDQEHKRSRQNFHRSRLG